jgi:protein gp37
MSISSIEWTEHTWNPIVGCSIVSPGCTNCYAMRMAARIEAAGTAPHYAGLTKKVNGNAVWTGKLALAPEITLTEPLRRKKPTMYFVNSMGDLFHEDCPDEWIDRVFAVMALCPQHTFQVLTKRADRMRAYMANVEREAYWMNAVADLFEIDGSLLNRCYPIMGQRDPWLPLPNAWLGVSCERQEEADERIPLLLQTPAAVRFISAEPLLGPIKLHERIGDDWLASGLSGERKGLDWIIVGGESGPKARPMHARWAADIRNQCRVARIPFFFKQWGEWKTVREARYYDVCEAVGFERVGKKAAGRLLDGREWNEFPSVKQIGAAA